MFRAAHAGVAASVSSSDARWQTDETGVVRSAGQGKPLKKKQQDMER